METAHHVLRWMLLASLSRWHHPVWCAITGTLTTSEQTQLAVTEQSKMSSAETEITLAAAAAGRSSAVVDGGREMGSFAAANMTSLPGSNVMVARGHQSGSKATPQASDAESLVPLKGVSEASVQLKSISGGGGGSDAAARALGMSPGTTAPGAQSTVGGVAAEVPVRLAEQTAVHPASVSHSRHRPEPGLAPSELKPSSRRTGVPDLDMLERPSKPRKGVALAPPALEVLALPKPAPAPTSLPKPTATSGQAGAELAGGRARSAAATIAAVAFLVCFVLCVGYLVFRRVSYRWHHRHYRKMDFLVDGMYNL